MREATDSPPSSQRAVALAALLAATSAVAGCATETAPADVRAQADLDPTIYGGERDQAATLSGVVALKVDTGATFDLCTGALVAPNVVLTARHCISKNKTRTIVCDEQGRSANGDHVVGDLDPASIQVYTGADPQFARRAVARGKQIVRGEGNVLCDGDIALLVLDAPIAGAKVMPVRIGQVVRPGETIKTIGYGKNDRELPVGTRMSKEGIGVLAVGRGTSPSQTALGAHEFETTMGTCEGDSGGPAISEKTGAIIGVVSRGGDCSEDFGHIYTSTVKQQALFTRALALASAVPELEAGSSLDPKSATFGADDDAPPATHKAGCSQSAAPASAGGSALAALALGLFAVAARRRSRQPS